MLQATTRFCSSKHASPLDVPCLPSASTSFARLFAATNVIMLLVRAFGEKQPWPLPLAHHLTACRPVLIYPRGHARKHASDGPWPTKPAVAKTEPCLLRLQLTEACPLPSTVLRLVTLLAHASRPCLHVTLPWSTRMHWLLLKPAGWHDGVFSAVGELAPSAAATTTPT